jgi:NADH-quinone oxidoreductase subunit N
VFTYLLLELTSICFYLLIGLKKTSIFSLEASIKYFIYTAFFSAFFVLGVSLIFYSTGMVSLPYIKLWISVENFYLGGVCFSLLLGIFFLLVSIFFKLAIVPFHFWIGDIYEGSSLIVVTFFSLIPKFIFIIFLFEFFFFFDLNGYLFLSIFGIFSILYGVFVSLYQIKIKKLVAFGTIAHIGYITLCLFVGDYFSIESGLYYLFAYLLVSLNIFGILIIVKQLNINLVYIVDIINVMKSSSFLALSFGCSMLSLCGIPPFIGFFGKLQIFFSLAFSGNLFLLSVVIFLTIISCVYYIRFIRFLFFKNFIFMNISETQNSFILLLVVITFFINIFFICLQYPLGFFIKYLVKIVL